MESKPPVRYAPVAAPVEAVCVICGDARAADPDRPFTIGIGGAVCEPCVLRLAEIIGRRDKLSA
jgi:hypothetical protein